MKKTNTTLAILFLMVAFVSASFAGTAVDTERLQLTMKNDVIQLQYKNTEEGLVKVAIKNEAGALIHSEEVSSEDGFLKDYDFSGKVEGFYTFEINDSEGNLAKEIGFFKPETILTMVKPSHNKFRLLYGVKRKSAIKVLLYNDKRDLVFEDIFVAENGFMKTYKVADYNTDATMMKVVTPLLTKEFELK